MRYRSKYYSAWADEDVPLANTGDWRSQRPVTDARKCARCGWCYLFCPTGSISDKTTHFEANLNYCKGCGICANVCLVHAIVMVREQKG